MNTRMCDDSKHAECKARGGMVSTIIATGPRTVQWGVPLACTCKCHRRAR